MSDLSSGTAVILAAVVLGLSHFLGTLVNRLSADISSVISASPNQAELFKARVKNKDLANELDISWLAKSYFRSMGIAGILILIMSLGLDYKFYGGADCLIILLVGVPIEILTVVAFFTQRKKFLKTQEELKLGSDK
jgi:hypothetical protein